MNHTYSESELIAHRFDVEAALADERDPEMKRSLRAELAATNSELAKVEEQKRYILSLAGTPAEVPGSDTGPDRDDLRLGGDRDRALRAIERHADRLASAAGDRLEEFVRHDRLGTDARYLAAVADPAYQRAFWMILASPQDAHLRMTTEENRALMRVNAVLAEARALGLADAVGGYAVPFLVDPTIMLTSDGVLNPVRKFASVKRITTDAWHGVSSAGLSAAFAAEATPVTDGAPSDLAQPVVYVEKAHAFVGFSIEIGGDWSTLQSEMGRLFADARDVLESAAFLSGAGHASHAPEGILVGATNTIDTAAASTFAIDDAYALVQAIPPRFAPRAVVLGNPVVFDAAYRFVGGASEEPPVLPTREGPFLGRRKAEWSEMDDGTSDGDSILIAGDVAAGFVIADRVGMQVELVPHLFDPTTALPTGQRGLYAYWRTGSAVVNAAALRVLTVQAS